MRAEGRLGHATRRRCRPCLKTAEGFAKTKTMTAVIAAVFEGAAPSWSRKNGNHVAAVRGLCITGPTVRRRNKEYDRVEV